MIDYSSPYYDPPRRWIKNCRRHNVSWYDLKNKNTDELELVKKYNFWPEEPVEEYYWGVLEDLKECEERRQRIEKNIGRGTLYTKGEGNDLAIPEDEDSCWVKYRQSLVEKGFNNVENIECECANILHRLSLDTQNKDAVKGLVVGYVQSGKTANMAGLISMAADSGWNVFIVLSGTIESLRIQTRDRLYRDLNNQCQWVWQTLDHLGPRSADQHPSQLNFDKRSFTKYLTICLKNKTRLTNLLKWINLDVNKKAQMKILLIDDEADQASINTSRQNAPRSTINRLIVNLIEGRDEKGKPQGNYAAMNYVSYTATPYANFLSEGVPESLYPRNFVTLLTPPNTYFGPLELFGATRCNKDGFGVVGMPGDPASKCGIIDVSEDTDSVISRLYNKETNTIPKSLKDAVCWFVCCVVILRKRRYAKPVSMLIHPSKLTHTHKTLADVVNDYLSGSKEVIIADCEDVYARKTAEFPKKMLFERYPNFGRDESEIEDYPEFSEIKNGILTLLEIPIEHIAIDKNNDKLMFKRGIHICIDNCKKDLLDNIDPDKDEDEVLMPRLVYPSDDDLQNLPSAPAFIVVGGNTLSRGLTIQGLVSTYFARPSAQGDTLMQMGRWFGYRRDYELLPRLWMSPSSYKAFELLNDIDYELRMHISDNYGVFTPVEFPAVVRRFPKTGHLRIITSPNKMRAAVQSGYNFEGTMIETNSFIRDMEIQTANLDLTEKFIHILGIPMKTQVGNGCIWRGVENNLLFEEFLSKFKFSKRLIKFNEMEELKNWIFNNTSTKWNVIVAGIGDTSKGTWNVGGGLLVSKIERSAVSDRENVVNIKTLSNPSDRFMDIPFSELNHEQKEVYKSGKDHPDAEWRNVRNKCNLSGIPALIIYRIAKNSDTTSPNRTPLKMGTDIIGLCMIMPGVDKSKLEAGYVGIPKEELEGA